MRYIIKYTIRTVAFLFLGSAAFLLSCNSKKGEGVNKETVVTLRSDSITMLVSKNGYKSYTFKADVMEQYGLATDPYTLYPKGIFVEKIKDSTDVVESTIRADQAVYYDNRGLWMASGNVVASGSGRTLYTEQLFWDAKTKRVYSNVRSRIVDPDGQHIGEGFESDETLNQWVFRNYEGSLSLDTTPASEEEMKENQEAEQAATANENGQQMQNGRVPGINSPQSPRRVSNPNFTPLRSNPDRNNNSRNGSNGR